MNDEAGTEASLVLAHIERRLRHGNRNEAFYLNRGETVALLPPPTDAGHLTLLWKPCLVTSGRTLLHEKPGEATESAF